MDNSIADLTENLDGNEIRSKYKELNEECEKILKKIKDNKKKSLTQQGK